MIQTINSFLTFACIAFTAASLQAQPPAPPLPPSVAIAPFPSFAPMPPLPPVAWEDAMLGSLPGALFAMQAAPRAPQEPERAGRLGGGRDRGDRYYSAGKSYLDRREYERAVEAFNRVIEQKTSRVDGALYWRAYAENKLGKRTEALSTLAELQKTYGSSRWVEDAKALQVEVQQASGRPVSPESSSDEDLKLLALSSLANSDPERTVPMLEKLLKGGNSAKLKERALFVLAQSRSPKGRELITQVARGNYNPDLQLKAVEYLGVFGGKDNQQALADIYKSTNDLAVKRKILSSFLICGCRESLLSIAKSESNQELRIEAINQLGVMGASNEILQLYTSEASSEVKRAVLQGLFIGGNAPGIINVARKESDPNLKREAVQKLSMMRSKEATDYLVELINK